MAQEINQTISAASLSTVSLPQMTYEEFLAWGDEDTWAEWVDSGSWSVISEEKNWFVLTTNH